MASLLTTIVDFLKANLEGDPAAGDPPPPGKLADIPDIIDSLSAIQLGTNNNGLADWLHELDAVLGDTQLRDTIVIRALQLRAPRLAEALTFAGLVECEFRDENPRAFAFTIAWPRLDAFLKTPGDTTLLAVLQRIQDLDDLKIAQVLTGKLLFSPRDLLAMEYAQQGYAALPNPLNDGVVDLGELVNQLIQSPLKVRVPITPPLDAATFITEATAAAAAPTNYLAIVGPNAAGAHALDGFGVELKLADVQAFAASTLDLGGGLMLVASSPDTGTRTYRLVMANGTFDRLQTSDGELDVALTWSPPGGMTMIGPANGTRLEIGPARISLRFQKGAPAPEPLFTFRTVVERVALVLSTEPLSLLANLGSLPSELRLQTDISVAYLQGHGIQAQGNGEGTPALGIEFAVPINVQAGVGSAGVSLERALVRLEAKVQGGALRARSIVRFGARGSFGPVSVFADGAGAWFGRWDNDETGGLERPTGMGLSFEAGPITGGGFLARVQDEFAGGFEAKVLGIGVGAFGLFGSAQGAPAFVAILGIRLPLPGVQIGFGFSISGVGGLFGLNRRADTDVLREQLATGTSAQILFCDNPSQNGLAVIGQLPRLFPPARGVIIAGPTLQISWLTLLRVDVGVFIELPGPRQIFIAGSARLIVGTEEVALLYLRMDFVGGVDLTKSLIYFDAALVNSHVMHVFTITGGVALRIAYGANGYFLFSVGGFHPSFNPGGLELPRLARAGASMSVDVIVSAWFKLETYLALTSNTFQLGASVEAGLELGPIGAHGWFRFDALVQYSPFYFTAAIDAGFDVEVFGESLYGVQVSGTLSGPGPLAVEARASLKILFVRVSGSVSFTLGPGGGSQIAPVADVLGPLTPELRKIANMRCDGVDTAVRLAAPQAAAIAGVPVLGVVGDLVWEQKRAPFALDLQRFEGAPLDRVHHITLSSSASGVTLEQDWFGVGTYLALSDSEALNNARFAQAQSGVRVPLSVMADGAAAPCDVNIELIKLPGRVSLGLLLAVPYMTADLLWMHTERAGLAVARPGEPRIVTKQESWTAHQASGAVTEQNVSATQAFSKARAGGGVALPSTASAISLAGVF